MTDIIPVAFAAQWSTPLHIIQKKSVMMIKGPAEALRYMKHHFAHKSGPAYFRAWNICLAAIRQETEPEISRVFFLIAYEDQLLSSAARR
jgi:hypothetical protein